MQSNYFPLFTSLPTAVPSGQGFSISGRVGYWTKYRVAGRVRFGQECRNIRSGISGYLFTLGYFRVYWISSLFRRQSIEPNINFLPNFFKMESGRTGQQVGFGYPLGTASRRCHRFDVGGVQIIIMQRWWLRVVDMVVENIDVAGVLIMQRWWLRMAIATASGAAGQRSEGSGKQHKPNLISDHFHHHPQHNYHLWSLSLFSRHPGT